MNDNIILNTDSYKIGHHPLYPDTCIYMQSYLESRCEKSQKLVYFGLQYIMKRYFEGIVVTENDVYEAYEFANKHFGRNDVFNLEGWLYIARDLGGKLPIRIYSLPEGTITHANRPLVVVESTDPKVFWIVNYIESILSKLWYSISVATNSYEIKKVLDKYTKLTSTKELNLFGLHDFGDRGVSSSETAGIGAMSNLVNFMGSDTISGILYAQKYYNTTAMVGYNIPATEHSVMTSHLNGNSELKALKLLLKTYPDGLIACVSDSYDIVKFIKQDVASLKNEILNRNGTLVIRPDSGDPVYTSRIVFNLLADIFGAETNSKGYWVLNPKVRIIYGDGVNKQTIEAILDNFYSHDISIDNIIFGSGGALLQRFNRDTYKFAFKTCFMKHLVGNKIVESPIFKQPYEFDMKGNYSKSYKTSKSGDLLSKYKDLKLVFENGCLVNECTFEEVRSLASAEF